MTKSQTIQLEQSKMRQQINDLLGKEELTTEERAELDSTTKRFQASEVELRAALVVEGEETRKAVESEPDIERRERLELRRAASLTNYLKAALGNGRLDGPELELRQAAGVDGIPLEIFDVGGDRTEHRVDMPTAAPSTVGVNLDMIQPAVFARSVIPRIGVEMPRVESGTYAIARINASLTAGTQGKGDAAESTPATFAPTTATPKRISGRLTVRLEDVAAVGASNFESSLRENLSLVLSDALDSQGLNGDGNGDNLRGFFLGLGTISPSDSVVGFDLFASTQAGLVDGLWAENLMETAILCGPNTYAKAAGVFAGGTSKSAAAYASEFTGGFWTSSRMPDVASSTKTQTAIGYRKGGMVEPGRMIRRAVCPHWGEISIDDIYSGSAKGERFLTMHVLVGDVIIVQPGAYAGLSYKLEA